jgi:hypothetical protein
VSPIWWADEDGGHASGDELGGRLGPTAWFAACAPISFALLILALAR